jgi:homoaconitase/3-isopropylmalate dehydratase large subunit
MSDRATITRLKKELAAARGKLKEAQAELKWRRKALRGSTTNDEYYAQVRADQDAVLDKVRQYYAQPAQPARGGGTRSQQDRLKKVDALANDPRGNKHERAAAMAMAGKLRGMFTDRGDT